MKKINEISIGVIAFNVCLVLLVFLLVFRMVNRNQLIEVMPTEEFRTLHLEKVCVQGEWDECYDFNGGGQLVELTFIKPSSSSENRVLYIKPLTR